MMRLSFSIGDLCRELQPVYCGVLGTFPESGAALEPRTTMSIERFGIWSF